MLEDAAFVVLNQTEGFGQWVLRSVWYSECFAHCGSSRRGISDEVLDWHMLIQSWFWLGWNSAGHYLCVLTSSGFIPAMFSKYSAIRALL